MNALQTVEPNAELVSIGVDPAEAYERGKTDINFFASLAMPEVCLFALPAFYVLIWQILVNRDPKDIGKILRFALGLPRGHAKTTFIKILLCWLIAYDKATFILVVCASADLAENLMEDIDAVLGSPNMEAVYGQWDAGKIQDTKKQILCRYHGKTIILVARGADSAVRGINIDNKRPDVIFLDDAQTKENDDSPTEREALLKRLVATVFKTISPTARDRLIIYVGNMYSDECILEKLRQNPKWISLITGAILANGEPLWPELHSLEDLMDSYEHDEAVGEAASWFAEVMNDPRSSGTSLLPRDLPTSPILSEDVEATPWDSTFITIDPAGFRKASDDNVIVVHGVFDGKGYGLEAIAGKLDPKEVIEEAFKAAIKWGCCLIAVEAVAYQQTLAFWIAHFKTEFGLPDIEVVELKPHGRSKEARIRQHIADMYEEEYHIADATFRAAYVWQGLKYKIGKKDNRDDLLDASAYYGDVRNDYWHLLKEPAHRLQSAKAVVVEDNTPF